MENVITTIILKIIIMRIKFASIVINNLKMFIYCGRIKEIFIIRNLLTVINVESNFKCSKI